MLSIKGRTFVPAKRSIKLLGIVCLGLLVLGAVAGVMEWYGLLDQLQAISFAVLVLFVGVFVIDFFSALGAEKIELIRHCPKSVAVDHWTVIDFVVNHNITRPTYVDVFELLDNDVEVQGLPQRVVLAVGQQSRSSYRIKLLERGLFHIRGCHVRSPSLLGLWQYQYTVDTPIDVRVYPDFSAVTAFTLLATDNHVSQLGIKQKPRRGEGMEFMQLRDYRRGDSMRQVDWKATSRRNKMISKQYQDERDQQVVLLIDSGRRMRAKDDELSHFDHSLNSLLLVSYIALRQGDNVSAMSFGYSNRWVGAQKGQGAMKTILNEMYDLQAGNCASDYIGAAEALAVRQRKRSLVILVTNSRDEDADEIVAATRLLSRRHLVLVANIGERVVSDIEKREVKDFDDALQYLGAQQYAKSRQKVLQKMSGSGVFVIDCLASELASRVANSYLEIKGSGIL